MADARALTRQLALVRARCAFTAMALRKDITAEDVHVPAVPRRRRRKAKPADMTKRLCLLRARVALAGIVAKTGHWPKGSPKGGEFMPGKGGQAPGVTVYHGGHAQRGEMHGVGFEPWKDAPTTTEGWAKVEGQKRDLKLPKLDTKGKKAGSGVVIQEKDGRVWVIEPTDHYGGYVHTFPKGTAEEGMGLQANAIKEAYEESGLKVRITGHLGDFERDTSVGRYYTAERVGGTPSDHGWETQHVKLVPAEHLTSYLNRSVDHKIAAAHKTKVGKTFQPHQHPRAPKGSPGAGQFLGNNHGPTPAHHVPFTSKFKAKGANPNNGALIAANKAIALFEHHASHLDLAGLHAIAPKVPKSFNPYTKAKHDAYAEALAHATHHANLKAQEEAANGPLKLSSLKKVGPQLGSNPGGQYEDKTGSLWYVKESKTDDIAKNELLTAALYKAAGQHTLDYKPVDTGGGKLGVATSWAEKAKSFNPHDAHDKAAAAQAFATHAWLANHDAVGLSDDNQKWINGALTTVDTGGGLLYRAQGGKKKDFGDTVTEWDSLRNHAVNAKAANVFAGMTAEQLQASAKHVESVTPETIKALVEAHGPDDAAGKKRLAAKLIKRRQDIIDRAAKLTPAAAPAPKTSESDDAAFFNDFELHPKPPKPAEPPKAAPAAAPAGHLGALPAKPQASAANAGHQKHNDALEAHAKAGEWDKVAAYQIKGVNSQWAKTGKYKDALLAHHATGAPAPAPGPAPAPAGPPELPANASGDTKDLHDAMTHASSNDAVKISTAENVANPKNIAWDDQSKAHAKAWLAHLKGTPAPARAPSAGMPQKPTGFKTPGGKDYKGAGLDKHEGDASQIETAMHAGDQRTLQFLTSDPAVQYTLHPANKEYADKALAYVQNSGKAPAAPAAAAPPAAAAAPAAPAAAPVKPTKFKAGSPKATSANHIEMLLRAKDAAAISAIQTHNSKELADYKAAALAHLGAGPAPAAAPAKTPKVNPARLEPPPTINLSSKPEVNVANTNAAKELHALAAAGDMAGLKAHPGTPSKHVQQYKDTLVAQLDDMLNPVKQVHSGATAFQAGSGTKKKGLSSYAASLDASSPPVPTGSSAPGGTIGNYMVAGTPGIADLTQFKGYQGTHVYETMVHDNNHGKAGWDKGKAGVLDAAALKAAHDTAFAKIPASQQSAVKSYTGSGYTAINKDVGKSLIAGSPSAQAKAADKAIRTAGQHLTPGTTLSRKISLSGSDLKALIASEGKVLQEPAISSTSIDPNAWSGSVHFKLIAGEGVKGLYVGAKSKGVYDAISNHPSEMEMLLPAGQRMLIQKVEHSGGYTKVIAVLLPNE